MKRKGRGLKIAGRLLAVTLAAGMAFQTPASVLAGTWAKDLIGWSFTDEKGVKVAGRWLFDNGNWYLIGQDGYMKTGWQLDNGKWYFLNTSTTNGVPEGSALKGWQWIDGKCYYFEQVGTVTRAAGSMYANEMTPDGFTVNKDGQWTENGSIVSVPGKGILTAITPGSNVSIGHAAGGGGGSSSGGGGGSSSGGSGSSSSKHDTTTKENKKDETTDKTDKPSSDNSNTDNTKNDTDTDTGKNDADEKTEITGSYTIYYEDEQGNVLKKETCTGTYGKTVNIEKISIDGYDYADGAGEKAFTKDTTSFIVTYRKKKTESEDDKKENCSYRFVYVDKDTEEELGVSDWMTAQEGKTVTWKEKTLKGCTLSAGNNLTRTVSSDKEEFTLYFENLGNTGRGCYCKNRRNRKGRRLHFCSAIRILGLRIRNDR